MDNLSVRRTDLESRIRDNNKMIELIVRPVWITSLGFESRIEHSSTNLDNSSVWKTDVESRIQINKMIELSSTNLDNLSDRKTDSE